MTHNQRKKNIALLLLALFAFVPSVMAQQTDDLQDYLDQLALQQASQPTARSQRRAESVEVPVGLTEVDLSKFTSYQNRTKTLTLKASVKFTNGIITAAAGYAGGTCLLKVYGGATVVLGETAGINAGAATSGACMAAVGIYEGSTFYECGNITAPDGGKGVAIYIDGANDTFCYVSGELTGSVSNEKGGTVKGLNLVKYTKAELQELLSTALSYLQSIEKEFSDASTNYQQLDNSFVPQSIYAYATKQLEEVRSGQYAPLAASYNQLKSKVDALSGYDDGTLHDQIEELCGKVDNQLYEVSQFIVRLTMVLKSQAAYMLKDSFSHLADDMSVSYLLQKISSMEAQFGTSYFMLTLTETLSAQFDEAKAIVKAANVEVDALASDANAALHAMKISSIADIVAEYKQLNELEEQKAIAHDHSVAAVELVDKLEVAVKEAEVNFPDEEQPFTLRPANIGKALQLGYKSNRGYVLTSAGMMWLEQVSGTQFRLTDGNDNYVVAKAGSGALTAGTRVEATIWTGISKGNGRYMFYSDELKRYLSCSGMEVNSELKTSASAYEWTIEASELDDLQAFLNLLSEEEETSGTASGAGDSSLTETDTLVYVLPWYDPATPTSTNDRSFVFPTTPYPIHIVQPDGGSWPIPSSVPGQPRPKDYHPIYVPEGSHVIIDDVTFTDLVGGDHVIYVEGTIEINVTVNINIVGWEWFVHVGPGGHVVWHPAGGDARPRIKNEGTMKIEEGQLDYVENTGTVNHDGGELHSVLNKNVYYFVSGVTHIVDNHAKYYHTGGSVLTATNYEGATYTMTGGTIANSDAGSTSAVFVNRGTLLFSGGTIGGYGSSLLYHGKGATLRIDGGVFDFTHVKQYWIEAYDYFYIRGNYDYKPTVPMLLAQGVTIRILYNWTYTFNIVFVGGRPTPRYPLFWADGFSLAASYYQYIGWTLPNSRWRWHYDDEANTIEPRDEEVEDEDDLQAYLDWLAENQDGDAASTEDEPQELDLKGRTIDIANTIEVPEGAHVSFVGGGVLKPTGVFGHDYVVRVPKGSSASFESVTFDFSQKSYYIDGATPTQRRLFDVYGVMHLNEGCHVKGYFDSSWQLTDSYIPGAVVYVDPSAHFYIDGGRLEQVMLLSSAVVNIHVTKNIVNTLWVYLPSSFCYDGYSFMAPAGTYRFTLDELRKIKLFGVSSVWGIEALPGSGCAALFDKKWMGDVNGDGKISIVDAIAAINGVQKVPSATFREARADLIEDGKITITDIISIVNLIKQ